MSIRADEVGGLIKNDVLLFFSQAHGFQVSGVKVAFDLLATDQAYWGGT